MSKALRIKRILENQFGVTISDEKLSHLAQALSRLKYASRASIKNTMMSADRFITESIDFSDTEHWIDQIVDIINND